MTPPLAFLAAAAAEPAAAAAAAGGHHDPVAPVLLALAVILLAAKLGGELFVRFGQPAVLGELLAGVLLGNLELIGLPGILPDLGGNPFVDIFARVGVVILLFEVGLETRLADMTKVGASSLLVATLGVITPMLLGFGVGTLLLPQMSFAGHLFLGAILTATSVGITARVLKDMGRLADRESRIILGAAVLDDVMGLILLAVVSGIVTAGSIAAGEVVRIIIVSILFLTASVVAGPLVARRAGRYIDSMKVPGMRFITALLFCFGMAWLADLVGLATIVGAFAAGMALEEWASSGSAGRPLREMVEPVSQILVPIFFVLMGFHVKLAALADLRALALAGAVTVAAVLGKQVCGLGVLEKGLDRLSVGLGMIPRGEVGLIFASIGAGLGVVDPTLFSATVLMVMATTMVTPVALGWAIRTRPRRLRSAARGER